MFNASCHTVMVKYCCMRVVKECVIFTAYYNDDLKKTFLTTNNKYKYYFQFSYEMILFLVAIRR